MPTNGLAELGVACGAGSEFIALSSSGALLLSIIVCLASYRAGNGVSLYGALRRGITAGFAGCTIAAQVTKLNPMSVVAETSPAADLGAGKFKRDEREQYRGGEATVYA